MKKFSSGFTLIELLVVIAVIGLLASIVLVSVSSARAKSNDAKLQQQMASIRSAAELYRISQGGTDFMYGSYRAGIASEACGQTSAGDNIFTNQSIGVDKIITSILAIPGVSITACYSNDQRWAIGVNLPTANPANSAWWCADYKGVSRKITSIVLTPAVFDRTGITSCPAN